MTMMKQNNLNEELLKRLKFLSEDFEKRKKKVDKEVESLEKMFIEMMDLKSKIDKNEQDNGV